MDKKRVAFLVAVGVACLILFAWWNAVPVAAYPEVQATATPRPTLTPTPLSSTGHPPRLHGGVLDWGKGYMPAGIQVVLKGDGWEIPVQTDKDGQYLYLDIGNEVAFLNALVPADRSELRALAADLPVRIRVDGELIVNMAFYPEGLVPDPIVTIKMSSSAKEARRGDNVSFTITVENKWDDWVNQVIVADYLPKGLTYVNATASQGQVTWDRGLVWVELGPVAAGSSATVTIMAQVDADAALDQAIANKAAVYYRENVAVQSEVSVKVVEKTNGVLPVTGVASVLPVAGVLLAGILFGVRRLRSAAR